MIDFLKRSLIGHALDIVAAILSYVAARYLLEMSTMEKDWLWLRRHWPIPELRWYRGPEYFHQVKGSRLLWQALSPIGS